LTIQLVPITRTFSLSRREADLAVGPSSSRPRAGWFVGLEKKVENSYSQLMGMIHPAC
jgi:hypothetical protein